MAREWSKSVGISEKDDEEFLHSFDSYKRKKEKTNWIKINMMFFMLHTHSEI